MKEEESNDDRKIFIVDVPTLPPPEKTPKIEKQTRTAFLFKGDWVWLKNQAKAKKYKTTSAYLRQIIRSFREANK